MTTTEPAIASVIPLGLRSLTTLPFVPRALTVKCGVGGSDQAVVHVAVLPRLENAPVVLDHRQPYIEVLLKKTSRLREGSGRQARVGHGQRVERRLSQRRLEPRRIVSRPEAEQFGTRDIRRVGI